MPGLAGVRSTHRWPVTKQHWPGTTALNHLGQVDRPGLEQVEVLLAEPISLVSLSKSSLLETFNIAASSQGARFNIMDSGSDVAKAAASRHSRSAAGRCRHRRRRRSMHESGLPTRPVSPSPLSQARLFAPSRPSGRLKTSGSGPYLHHRCISMRHMIQPW